ncbi:MAG: ABC transporter permease, partial [Albidovulum sp.]
MIWFWGAIGFWLVAWAFNAWAAVQDFAQTRFWRLAIPGLFGVTLLILWEGTVRGLNVPGVILPAPSAIWVTIQNSLPILAKDFVQTILKGALSGYVMGCGAAILTAIAIDRSPFLQAGLLPVGNFAAALPIVGVAPILVMWFGFDWHSKAAIVVVMVFFPVLV